MNSLSPDLTLPALKVNYNGLPRRYEETKPVFVQNFTHQRIVGIGKDIQRRILDSIEAEKLEDLRKAEEAVWVQAKKEKLDAVKKAREEEKATAEKILQRKIKEYEQKIREECLKIEMAMQKLAMEQLKEERARGERAKEEAIKKTEERCHQELLAAVDSARKEEKQIASDAQARLMKKHETEFNEYKKFAADDKKQALETLKNTKDTERIRAVKEAQDFTQKVADKRLREVREEHKTEICKYNDVVSSWQDEVRAREVIIGQLEKSKAKVGDKLLDGGRRGSRYQSNTEL